MTLKLNKHSVFISIGSNIGDRFKNFQDAICKIENLENTKVIQKSNLYETEPLENKNQDSFLNCAIKIETKMEPNELLLNLQKIERLLGRVKSNIRYAPRTLDLDIIFFDNLIIKNKKLEIPHPKAHKRAFVLRPICDIEKNFVHPLLNRKVCEILIQLKGQKIEKWHQDL